MVHRPTAQKPQVRPAVTFLYHSDSIRAVNHITRRHDYVSNADHHLLRRIISHPVDPTIFEFTGPPEPTVLDQAKKKEEGDEQKLKKIRIN